MGCLRRQVEYSGCRFGAIRCKLVQFARRLLGKSARDVACDPCDPCNFPLGAFPVPVSSVSTCTLLICSSQYCVSVLTACTSALLQSISQSVSQSFSPQPSGRHLVCGRRIKVGGLAPINKCNWLAPERKTQRRGGDGGSRAEPQKAFSSTLLKVNSSCPSFFLTY